jgi:predicted Fe-S protein YdhL (DUF1289 family)
MIKDSPCTGVCRMEGTRCKACHRTYKDISEWFDMSKSARLKRMEELKHESD